VRIGLLADIHDDAERLSAALAQFARQRADRIVVLGDTLTCVSDPDCVRVTELLRAAGAIGVWGNHDFGLCHDVSYEVQRGADPRVLEFMATLRPNLEVGGCLFSHVEPWLDPWDVSQLWWYDGPPDTAEKAARSFAAVDQRFLFLGHFHRWLLMTPTGAVPWPGTEPIGLGACERCLVVVAAVFEGNCAIFDTERTELIPLPCEVTEG